jgi:hypothetical protein
MAFWAGVCWASAVEASGHGAPAEAEAGAQPKAQRTGSRGARGTGGTGGAREGRGDGEVQFVVPRAPTGRQRRTGPSLRWPQ